MNTSTAAALIALAAALPAAAQDGLPLPMPKGGPTDQDRGQDKPADKPEDEPKDEPKDAALGLVQGTLTGSREDDPSEDRPRLQLEGSLQARLVVGSKLLGVLREHALNRIVRVEARAQGADEVRVTAIEAIATEDLPIYAKGANLSKAAPIGVLPKGTRTLVTGGRIYGMQNSGKFPKGLVMLTRLSFGEPLVPADGEHPPAGMIDALQD